MCQTHPASYLIPIRLPTFAVLFQEFLNPSGRVNQLLLTGKKRMTLVADFHLDITQRGTGLKSIPTGAGYGAHFVFRMNSFFHNTSSFSHKYSAHQYNIIFRDMQAI